MRVKSEKNNREYIIKNAVELAEKIGRDNVQFELLSSKLGISRTIFYKIFGSTEELKEEILKFSIENEVMILILEAVIFNKVKISDLSASIRKKISRYFSLI